MRKFVTVFAATLGIFAFTLTPVFAEGHGSGSGSGQDAQTTMESSQENAKEAKERAMEVRQKAQEAKAEQKAKAEDAKQKADEIIAEAKDKRKEIKKEVCEQRQNKLKEIPERVSSRAAQHQKTFDGIYQRVQDFYAKGKVNVENYDSLKAAVDSAKATSAADVAAIGEIQVSVDCDNPNLGQQLDSIRTATQNARTSLKAYRSALVSLINAVHMASEKSNPNETNNSMGAQ